MKRISWAGTRTVVVVATLVSGLALATAAGAATIVLPRAGQVGIGIQGQYGGLAKAGELGSEFGAGPGIAVRLRYRMRYERALGLSFETQEHDARHAGRGAGAFDALAQVGDTLLTRDRLKLVTAGVELYQLFGTRTKSTKMLSAGIGIAQVSAHLSDGETQYPIAGDGVYASVGAGVEKFFYRSWAWDLSTRYKAIFHDGKVNHDVQLSLGMIFYAAY